MASTNWESDAMLHFDSLAAKIERTFDQLIEQLIGRKGALLRKVLQLREDFHNKEAARREAIQELEEAQQHLRQLSLKANLNIPIYQQANQAYGKEMGRLSTVTKFPTISFDDPTRDELLELGASYGEIYGGTEYEDLNEPIRTVGHEEKLGNFGDFRGLALNDSTVYAADLKNGRILSFSSQGELKGIFGEEILKKPWGVTVEKDNIFVTDVTLHSLLRFDKKTLQPIDRIGSEGTGDGMLSFPLGLDVDMNGDIYVADSENDRISIFSKNMEFLHCLGQKELLYPVDIKLTLETVVVLDWSSKCVHFFLKGVHHFFSYVAQGLGPECIVSSPLYFCLDKVENIFISGSNNDITIISGIGEFVKKFGGLGDKRGNYRGVAISETGRIFAVSNNSQHFLQIF